MPCKKRMVGCKRTCLHRNDVREYSAAREAAEVQREAETGGYAAEIEQYRPIITFKSWLQDKGA